VLGDLLLPAQPSPSSRAGCRDIAQKLGEWQGPGVVVLSGQLVAPRSDATIDPSTALLAHHDLMAAFTAFAARPESRVVAVVGEAGLPDDVAEVLGAHGVSLEAGVDLHCMTGAGVRNVLIRTGTPYADTRHPSDAAAPGNDRPWLAGMERLDDPVWPRASSLPLALPAPAPLPVGTPLVLAGLALLLRLEFVVDGLGRVFHSPRQQRALQQAYAASWFSRLLVTIAIGVVLIAVLAAVVAITSRGIWRAFGGEGLPSPWSSEGARTQGLHPAAHALLTIEGKDVLDVTRDAIAGGAAGMIVGGALVAELTHLDAGFFASPAPHRRSCTSIGAGSAFRRPISIIARRP